MLSAALKGGAAAPAPAPAPASSEDAQPQDYAINPRRRGNDVEVPFLIGSVGVGSLRTPRARRVTAGGSRRAAQQEHGACVGLRRLRLLARCAAACFRHLASRRSARLRRVALASSGALRRVTARGAAHMTPSRPAGITALCGGAAARPQLTPAPVGTAHTRLRV